MLEIFSSPGQISYYELSLVYEESNRKKGKELCPWADISEQWLEGDQWLYRYIRNDFFQVKDAFIAAWSVRFSYAAIVRVEPYLDGFLINGLETRPDMRHRGYGKMLLLSVLQYMRKERKVPVYSHVDRSNQASVSIHNAVGFKPIEGRGSIYLDGSVHPDSITYIAK